MPDVYVSQIDFGDGILRSFKGEGGGGITDFVDVPTVENTELYYDGTEKTLVFDNLDTDKVTVSGTTSATEEGNYTCTLTLTDEQYCWKDLTKEPITIEWVILPPIHVYGVEWDGTSTTAWTRTDESTNFTDPNPYYKNMSTTPSSPFDDLLPWSGMIIEERTGGTMVKIPKFWYALTQNGSGLKIQIADGPQEGFDVSPAHMDRGDGNGERDAVYIGRYKCAASNYPDGYKSVKSRTPMKSVTRTDARNAIHSLGSNIWQYDFATMFTIWLLYLVEFADWNSQKVIGYGCGNGSSAGSTGSTATMPYHTGTMQTARTTYGAGTQYRNIEGLWDNLFEFIDGCRYSSVGLCIILNPNSFSDSSGGFLVGNPSSGFPSAFSVKNTAGTFKLFIPTTSNGSNTTYSCDNWNSSTEYPAIRAGGNFNKVLNSGLFCIASSSSDTAATDGGCRIIELP